MARSNLTDVRAARHSKHTRRLAECGHPYGHRTNGNSHDRRATPNRARRDAAIREPVDSWVVCDSLGVCGLLTRQLTPRICGDAEHFVRRLQRLVLRHVPGVRCEEAVEILDEMVTLPCIPLNLEPHANHFTARAAPTRLVEAPGLASSPDARRRLDSDSIHASYVFASSCSTTERTTQHRCRHRTRTSNENKRPSPTIERAAPMVCRCARTLTRFRSLPSLRESAGTRTTTRESEPRAGLHAR